MPAFHEDEFSIDTHLVRQLLRQSLPQCADLPLAPLESSGSSNALFRLGDDLLVRLPRQPGGSATIEKEARWLPVVASGLSAAVPDVIAVGDPGFGYPEKWAVTRWIEGEMPSVPPTIVGPSRELADELAQLVSELRKVPVPPAAHADPALCWYRGGELADLDQTFRRSVEACRTIDDLRLDLDRALSVWEDALDAELAAPGLRTWYHGDLLAENLVTRHGHLVAVLDFGGLGVGDPTVDLIAAWEVLDSAGRQAFRKGVGVDDATWTKGMGWALVIAMITFPYYWHTMAAAVLAEG